MANVKFKDVIENENGKKKGTISINFKGIEAEFEVTAEMVDFYSKIEENMQKNLLKVLNEKKLITSAEFKKGGIKEEKIMQIILDQGEEGIAELMGKAKEEEINELFKNVLPLEDIKGYFLKTSVEAMASKEYSEFMNHVMDKIKEELTSDTPS